MQDKAERLRALHKTPPILVLPNAWDAVSARLFEAEGFPAIATTSAGVAATLGYQDGGAVPAHEMIDAVSRIARAVQVPVTADIEHAYATTPDAVADVVTRVVAAGAVGINLEDILPGAPDLEPLAIQADKIATVAKATRKAGVPVVINARTDVFLRAIGAPETRLGVAIERGRAYLAAGADCVFVPGAFDRETIAALVAGIGGPINIIALAGAEATPGGEALGGPRGPGRSRPQRATMGPTQGIPGERKKRGTHDSFTRPPGAD